MIEHGRRFPAEIGHEPPFGMRCELSTIKHPDRRRLMVEQRAAAAIEGPDRGDPWRRTGQLVAEMVEHSGRDDLDRIERAILRKPICRARASRLSELRRSRTRANSFSLSVKKCSISSVDNVSGNRS
jgi:hypothetical protein